METTTTTSTPATAPRKTGKKTERIPLKALCKTLRIEPKATRRKLRAAKFSWHASRERWTMTEAQAARAREILKPSKAPKAAAPAADEAKPN